MKSLGIQGDSGNQSYVAEHLYEKHGLLRKDGRGGYGVIEIVCGSEGLAS